MTQSARQREGSSRAACARVRDVRTPSAVRARGVLEAAWLQGCRNQICLAPIDIIMRTIVCVVSAKMSVTDSEQFWDMAC